jgi:hypothetical protein
VAIFTTTLFALVCRDLMPLSFFSARHLEPLDLGVRVKEEDADEAAACPDLMVETDENRDAMRAGWFTWAHKEAPHVAHAARAGIDYTQCLLKAKSYEEYLELRKDLIRQIYKK